MDYEAFAWHLIELRSRLIKILLSFVFVFLIAWFFSEHLFYWFCKPTLSLASKDYQLIAVDVTAPFMIPMKLAALFSIFFTAPYWLHQIWGFVLPALYKHELKKTKYLFGFSTGLFYLGSCFSFFIIVPMALRFFSSILPQNVVMMNDIRNYLDFVWQLVLAGGLAFQVPLIAYLLVLFDIVSAQDLKACRRYVIVGAFVLGMLLTPPDVVSQILLALPMWFLFELGLWFSIRHARKFKKSI
ncbi:MAG: twin-arginine translocase subunit TatC [Gammaproteobacteria bacterium]